LYKNLIKIMQFHKAILPAVIAGASIVLSSLPSRAAVITYTDRNSFLAALSSSSTDNYNDLATGYVSSPLDRSIPGYDYNAVGLILLSSDYGSKILWNGVNGDFYGVNGDILTLNFTAGYPTAVGGYFFNFNSSNPTNDVVVTVTAYPGAIVQSTVTSSATNFFGWIDDSGTPFTSLVIKPGSSAAYPTVDDLILGQAAPHPSPAEVPGPLPVMGAAAAFPISRRLRSRIAAARPRA
jgi:hypothetical protein